ncbi:MAG: TIGR00282 family metallophosphoesterase [Candidatus Andersenbacteria bacterium]
MTPLRFLIFGDIMGRLGRVGISRILPQLRQEYSPDAVVINIENIAHGKGISLATLEEALAWKANVYTTGDHAWDYKAAGEFLNDQTVPIIRPANYDDKFAGRGYHIFTLGSARVAVLQLQGQVFMKTEPANPFQELDRLLDIPEIAQANIRLLDFHAEATSEKRGIGWHADGRISAVWGTHTHIPTADAQILPHGTGYISDAGMNGGYHTIIGMAPEGPLYRFRTDKKTRIEPPTEGPIEINAVLFDIDPDSGKTTDIAFIRKILND